MVNGYSFARETASEVLLRGGRFASQSRLSNAVANDIAMSQLAGLLHQVCGFRILDF